jgi:hypothetical protein
VAELVRCFSDRDNACPCGPNVSYYLFVLHSLEGDHEIHTDDLAVVRFHRARRYCADYEKRAHQNLRWDPYP